MRDAVAESGKPMPEEETGVSIRLWHDRRRMRVTVWVAGLWLAAVLAHGGPFGGWANRVRITFSGYDRAETLTNFPALVTLGPGIAKFSYAGFRSTNAAGEVNADLRFTDAADSRELNYEIDTWNTNGDSLVWVQVPALSSNGTSIHAYWGMAGAAAPGYTADGRTWSNSYAGVWHLREEAPGTTNTGLYRDSSTNRCHGTDRISASGRGGLIVFGKVFDGVNDYVEVPDRDVLSFGNGVTDQPMTLSAWSRAASVTNNRIICKGHQGGTVPEYSFSVSATTTQLTMQLYAATQTDRISRISSMSLGGYSNQWIHLAVTYDGSRDPAGIRLWLNGDELDSFPTNRGTYTAMANKTATFDIGAFLRSSGGFALFQDGNIDEVEVSRVARSPAWVWASWSNQVPGSQFVTYGPVSGMRGALIWLL